MIDDVDRLTIPKLNIFGILHIDLLSPDASDRQHTAIRADTLRYIINGKRLKKPLILSSYIPL